MLAARAPSTSARGAAHLNRASRLRVVASATPRDVRANSTVAEVAQAVAAVAPAVTHVVEVSAANFHDFLAQHTDKLVVVDLYTTWCGPCKAMAPVMEKWSEEMDASRVVFAKFNCGADDDNKRFAIGLGVKALPTFQLYRGPNQKVGEMTGAKQVALKKLIEDAA